MVVLQFNIRSVCACFEAAWVAETYVLLAGQATGTENSTLKAIWFSFLFSNEVWICNAV